MTRPQRHRSVPKKFAVYHLGYVHKEQQGTYKTEKPDYKKQASQIVDSPTRRESRRGHAIKDVEENKLTDIVATQKRRSARSKAENEKRRNAVKLPAASTPITWSGNLRTVESKEEEEIDTPKSSSALKRRVRVGKKEDTNSSSEKKRTRTSDFEKRHSGNPGPSTSTRRRSTRRTKTKKMVPNCQVDEDVWEKMNPPPTPMNPRDIVAQAAFRPKVDISAPIDELDSSDEEYVGEYQHVRTPDNDTDTEDNDTDVDYEELDLEELITRASRRMGTSKS